MASRTDARRQEVAAGTRGAPGDQIILGEDRSVLLRAARSSCTILITGETGVGKGYLARWLHTHSRRSSERLVAVNCGAIPETLVDSQLFGHVRGAFSGATRDQLGFVRASAGGTLFLDEVAELPSTAQTRLLRLLQEHEIQPVGHPHPFQVDVRVMAASNADLQTAVAEKTFREDLLYRLDVIRVHLRPLRERTDEIPALITTFNHEFAEQYSRPPIRFSGLALEMLRHYQWPGNVRQLRTVLERLHVLASDGEVGRTELVEIARLHDLRDEQTHRPFEDVKLEEVRRILASTGGSVSRTAEVFGVHRSTVYRWLNRRPRPM